MPKVPKYFIPLAIFATIWNAMGCLSFSMTMLRYEDYLAEFTPEELEYFISFPMWMNAAWGVAWWSGLLGSIMLLFKKTFAVTAFIFSFSIMIICNGYTYVLRDDAIEMISESGNWFAGVIFILALCFWIVSAHLRNREALT
jgi:hypothetical protein